MLFKGKRGGYYLYELTPSDLAWEDADTTHYQKGNILLFSDKKQIALGAEAARADDLSSAYDYLEGKVCEHAVTSLHEGEAIALLEKQLTHSKASLKRRDDLLGELTADLESQRNSNQVLIAQLEALREQVHIEKISKEEVLGDLEFASAETYRKDQELQAAIDAKAQLEQELAARICELLELDSANTDLQKKLQQQATEEASLQQHAPKESLTSTPPQPPDNRQSIQVLTTATGKQVHVYHEFPKSGRQGFSKRMLSMRGLLRSFGLILIAVVILVVGSVFATAHLNGISPGEALDATLKTLSLSES